MGGRVLHVMDQVLVDDCCSTVTSYFMAMVCDIINIASLGEL